MTPDELTKAIRDGILEAIGCVLLWLIGSIVVGTLCQAIVNYFLS